MSLPNRNYYLYLRKDQRLLTLIINHLKPLSYSLAMYLRKFHFLALPTLLLPICNSLSAQVLQTEYLTTTSADISNSSFNGGTEYWSNLGNAATDNNNYTTIANAALTIGGTTRNSHYLTLKNFGFAIPEGHEILGVQVEIRRFSSESSSTNWTKDLDIRLINGSTIVGDNRANISVNWPINEAATEYGSNTDLWGTALSREEVNSSDFGVAIAAESRAAGLLLPTVISYIDQVRIKIYYQLQPLPVNLKDYKLSRTGNNGIQLYWQTVSEQHNKDFLIFRKTSNQDFIQIGTVAGQGNSSTEKYYRFHDPRPAIGTNYYKLIQQDLDGRKNEIGLEHIEFNLDERQSWASFEAQSGMANLGFPAGKYTVLSIFDTNGKRWIQQSITTHERNKFVAMTNYPKGIYLIKLQGNTALETLKIVIP